MKIDLFYYTPYFNNYYFVYGPEKDSNGDIIIKSTGYYFAEANDMVAKLRSMADSLAPEITNVQARTQGNSFWIYVGDLNTGSEVPDYTQVLTRIANALDTNSQDNIVNKLQSINEKFIYQNESLAVKLQNMNLNLGFIRQRLNLSSNSNTSITDVISALNATIDSKQDTTIVNNEVTPLAEINIDVPFEVKNLKKSDFENL